MNIINNNYVFGFVIPTPIRVCANHGTPLTSFGYVLECKHVIQKETAIIIQKNTYESSGFCNTCQRQSNILYMQCGNCGEEYNCTFPYDCYWCMRNECPALLVSAKYQKKCNSRAAFNNGGFCKKHLSWSRIHYWLMKGLKQETPLCEDIMKLLMPYLHYVL